jgi:hypothetical protein
MNRIAMFCASLLLVSTMSGCCLFGHGHGGGFGGGYPSQFGGGGACGCGPQAPGGFGYPSAMGGGMQQAAFGMQQTAFAPGFGYPTMAMDPLPTIIR